MFSKITILATLITWALPALISIYFTYFSRARFSEFGPGLAILICSAWTIGISLVVSTIVIWYKTHSGAGIAGYFIANAIIFGIILLNFFSWEIKEFILETKENMSIRTENRSLYAEALKGKLLDEFCDDRQTKYEFYATKETIYLVEFSGKDNKVIEHIIYAPADKDVDAGYTKVYEINHKKYSLWAMKKLPKKAWWKNYWVVYADGVGFFVADDDITERLMKWRKENEYTVFYRDIDNFMQNEYLWDRVVAHEDSRQIFDTDRGLREYNIYYLDGKLFIKKTECFLEGIPVSRYKGGADEEIFSLTTVEMLPVNEDDYDKVYENRINDERFTILFRHKKDEKDWALHLKLNSKAEGFYKIDIDVVYDEIYRYYDNVYRQNSSDYIIHHKTIYDEITKTFE